MKKSKFSKLIGASAKKHVMFNSDGRSMIGKVIGHGSSPDTAIVKLDAYPHAEMEIPRKHIIGRIRKSEWFTMDHTPPEDSPVLLEHKSGDIKMGRLLGKDGKEFYELDGHHFHDPYWHKPSPITDFSHWSLIRGRN